MAGGDFDGQVAVVTGGAQGIGFAISRLLSERGATVCLLDLDPARMDEAVGKLKANGGKAKGYVGDVTKEPTLQRARDAILKDWGQVHVLVNNAGIYPHARIHEITEQVRHRFDDAERGAYQLFSPKRAAALKAAQSPQPPPSDPSRRRRSAEPPMPVPQPPEVQEVRIREDSSLLAGYVYAHWERLYQIALLASFIPFLVYFMLSWRDHMRRSYLQLFHGEGRHAAGRSWQGIADMARAYVVGNFVLGLVITFFGGLFFWRFNVPYWPLVSILSGFLSLVPYVGLPLAMIPPFFAALPVYDKMGAYVIIGAVVGFLHLVAMNLLYPKLVGSRVHLNPLAVTVALMFWGSLWGAIGLVFAIPITAGVKSVADNVPELQPYGKLLGD